MESTQVSRALTATTSVASALGLRVEDAIVIQRANRLTVRLEPCDVLVRIAATVRRNQEIAAFELEIARRFEEARIDPLALIGDEVEHFVDQPGRSEHLAVVNDALTGVRHGWSAEIGRLIRSHPRRFFLCH